MERRRGQPIVAVYAIARDEEAHVVRWADSAQDADVVLIADTGSSDNTIAVAHEHGVAVQSITVEPFRYDAARNRALDLVPREVDLCVALDLDEVLLPGWRDQIDVVWETGATRIQCWLEWPWSDVYPALRYRADRIHARHGYSWQRPVHEQIVPAGLETVAPAPITIRHLRDSSRPRPDYLGLLRLGAAEQPDDGQVAHMLANEARMRGRPDEARAQAHRALRLTPGGFERLHTMLMLSWLEPDTGEQWLLTACREFGDQREGWCELARFHAERGHWRASYAAATTALRIGGGPDHYLQNVFAWGHWPEQLAATAAARLGDQGLASHHARRALAAAPGDAALQDAMCSYLQPGARITQISPPEPDLAPSSRAREQPTDPADSSPSCHPALVIIIPVLGRPHRVEPLLTNVADVTPQPYRVLFIADHEDRVEIEALEAAGGEYVVLRHSQRCNYAAKINHGFRITDEPLVFQGADDLHFFPEWFEHAYQRLDARGIHVVGTNDLYNPRVLRGEHSTHSLFERCYIDDHGTIDTPGEVMHEGYPHEYADDEFVLTAASRHAFMVAQDSIVEHLHPYAGKAPDDWVYEKGRTDAMRGYELFQRRRKLWE